MSNIDWSATKVKELLEGFDDEIKAEFETPAPDTITTAKGGAFGFTSNGEDSYLAYVEGYNKAMDKYRNAIIRELIRLRGISPLTGSVEDPTTDPLLSRIDELLTILEDVEGAEQ